MNIPSFVFHYFTNSLLLRYNGYSFPLLPFYEVLNWVWKEELGLNLSALLRVEHVGDKDKRRGIVNEGNNFEDLCLSLHILDTVGLKTLGDL